MGDAELVLDGFASGSDVDLDHRVECVREPLLSERVQTLQFDASPSLPVCKHRHHVVVDAVECRQVVHRVDLGTCRAFVEDDLSPDDSHRLGICDEHAQHGALLRDDGELAVLGSDQVHELQRGGRHCYGGWCW